MTAQTFSSIEIIVVDNGSTDGSSEYIRQAFPEVKLIPQTLNRGFAGGVNVGIEAAQGEYLALLNNDAVAEPTWIEMLVSGLQRVDGAGACTSKLLRDFGDERRIIDSAGDWHTIWGIPYAGGRDEHDDGRFDEFQEVFSACGGACIYTSEMLGKIGIFDEEFFAYYEDVDLCFRARLLGYKVVYQPRAVVHHKLGGTSGGGASPFTRYHAVKNLWYLYLKNMPGTLFWIYLPRFFLTQALMFVSSIQKGLLGPHLRAWLRNLLMTPSMLVQRNRIQKKRKLSSREVDALLEKTFPPAFRLRLNDFPILRRLGRGGVPAGPS